MIPLIRNLYALVKPTAQVRYRRWISGDHRTRMSLLRACVTQKRVRSWLKWDDSQTKMRGNLWSWGHQEKYKPHLNSIPWKLREIIGCENYGGQFHLKKKFLLRQGLRLASNSLCSQRWLWTSVAPECWDFLARVATLDFLWCWRLQPELCIY